LVQDLDEAVKEVNLLGEHEDESSQKITKLEALCKRLREDAQKLREEKTTLEGMIQSCDELILEMAKEYGLNLMGENDDDEDEDDDDEGNAVAPPIPAPAAVPEEIIEEEDPVENGPQELDDLDDLGEYPPNRKPLSIQCGFKCAKEPLGSLHCVYYMYEHLRICGLYRVNREYVSHHCFTYLYFVSLFFHCLLNSFLLH
jgi:hypothetical protein